MNPLITQQRALDDALVAPEDRYVIGKLPNQEFVEPPSHENLSLSSNNLVTEENWNLSLRCVDQLQLSRAQILWEVTKTKAYKTYLAFAIRIAIPNKARKRTTTHINERYLKANDNIIPDDPDATLELAISISRTKAEEQEAAILVHETHEYTPTETKKKTPEQSLKLKGMKMFSDAAMLVAETKKVIKASKCDFRSQHQAGDSSKGVGSKLGVLDESKGKTKDINEGAGSKPEVPNVSKAKSSDQENSEEEPEGDEFVHTPDDYVPTDDETQDIDDEEYIRINEELYDDVNVERKVVEPDDESKGDEEMTNAEKVDAEHKEINKEVASAKSSSLVTVLVSVIPEPIVLSSIPEITTEAPATTISPFIPLFIPIPPHSTPIPTPTTTEATTSTPAVPKSKTLSAIHLRVSDLEKEVKEIKNVDHSTTLLETIKSEVLTAVKEYLGTSLGDALHKVLQRHTTKLVKEHYVLADVIEVLKQQQKPQKSVADIRKIKMEHAVKQQES
ncbi:hypothetical protein Tco_0511705 [Tanacetum coccineum]